jgi:hypothetical protein
MNEIYKKQLEVVCSVVLILLAVLIPRYVKLPKNIKLLFNDRISQVLLLALVILIVIYNFLCGVLLFVFFASMMIASSQNNTVEGFDSKNNMEMKDDEEYFKDDEEDISTETKPTKTPKSTKPTKPSMDTDTKEQIATYQTAINSLKSKIDELKTEPTKAPKQLTNEPTPTEEVEDEEEGFYSPKRTPKPKKVKSIKSKLGNDGFEDVEEVEIEDEDIEGFYSPKRTPKPKKVKSIKSKLGNDGFEDVEEVEIEDEDIEGFYSPKRTPKPKKVKSIKSKLGNDGFEDVEGFSCGCDSNSRQVKLIKYAESQSVDPSLSDLFEKFENPSVAVKTPNPFDVAGCRYDMKESNPLHETTYGAPVDSCQAYSQSNVNQCGTVFYPLNAF